MKRRLFSFRNLLLVLTICFLSIDSFANSYSNRNESFKLYFSSGTAIPIGDASKILKTGYHLSGGVGIILTSKSKITSELNVKISGSSLKTKDLDTYVNNNYIILNSHEITNYFSFEGRFRIENNRRLRPYFAFGFGFASGGDILPNTVSIVGIGIDLVTNNGARPFYSELRLMSSEYSYMVLSIGIRIG